MYLKIVLKSIIIVLIIWSILINPKLDEPKNLSMYLVAMSFALLATDHLEVLNFLSPELNISTELNWIDYAIAIFSLSIGIWLNIYEKKQYYAFNLLGENNKKMLASNNYKVKNLNTGIVRERSIDFMLPVEETGMQKYTNNIVNEMIRREVEHLESFPSEKEIYIISMASIPYTILFGGSLNNKKTIKYIDYKRNVIDSNSSFVLLPNKVRDSKSVPLKIEEEFQNSEFLLLSLSVTYKITESDIKDFDIANQIHISTANIEENIISSQDEVRTIANQVVNHIINNIDMIQEVHIAAAIPGMLAFELGRVIRNRGNSFPKAIVYHYNTHSNPKYRYGIIVNGEEKGRLIDRR